MSLITTEMQIKPIMRYRFIPVIKKIRAQQFVFLTSPPHDACSSLRTPSSSHQNRSVLSREVCFGAFSRYWAIESKRRLLKFLWSYLYFVILSLTFPVEKLTGFRVLLQLNLTVLLCFHMHNILYLFPSIAHHCKNVRLKMLTEFTL